MIGFRRHSAPVGALAAVVALSLLSGCSVFRSNPVPAPPPPPKSLASIDDATPARMRDWLIRDEDGEVTGFRPLRRAESALAEAEGAPAAAEHAADELAAARSGVSEAKSQWQAIAEDPLNRPEALSEAAYAAHGARRRAEIAVAIGEREAGLRRLAEVQAALEKRDAADSRWVGQTLVPGRFGEVRFAAGTARLTQKSFEVIERLAEFLREHPRYGLRLVGHTDNQPPSERSLQQFLSAHPGMADNAASKAERAAAYNRDMSARRAGAVQQALVEAGIAAERLQSEGRGAAEPIASNDSPAGRSENRRVEAIVTRAGG